MSGSSALLFESSWLPALGWGMLHALWQGMLIAAVAALLLARMRGNDSPSRYTVAFVSLMAVPAACGLTIWRTLAGPSASPVFPLSGFAFLAPWVGFAWLVGVSGASVKLAVGWLRLQRLRTGAVQAPRRWQHVVDALAITLGIGRSVRLMETALADVPGTIGWLSPMILFPVGLLGGLTPDQARLIIAHELAHIRRHDYVANLVQTAVETAFFFHPAVWWLSRRIREEREHCCDDAVVAEFADRRLYAEALADIERLRSRSTPGLALAAGGGNLLGRITRLLDEPSFPARPVSPVLIGSVMISVMLAVAFAGGAAQAAPLVAVAASSVWFGAALGLVIGMRHALEPDHLVAISTLVADERSGVKGASLGVSWGLGHTITLLLVGSGLAVVRVNMPQPATELLEAGVGVMLVGLGLRALRSAWMLAATGPETTHSHGSLLHRHATASTDHMHIGALAVARRPLIVGMVHGLAGSGALAALAMATLPRVEVQILFMVLFGIGSTIGMAALSGFVGRPVARLARRPVAFAWASAAAGVISLVAGLLWLGSSIAFAQGSAGRVSGSVTDMTGGRLPGVVVVLNRDGARRQTVTTDGMGRYEFASVPPGDYDVTFSVINFAPVRRPVRVSAGQSVSLDAVLRLTLTADVTVTGRQTFTNLADVADPAANLVGIAGAASEGAITSQQILDRPIMRAGEVLETVPGLIISQHSGEGKANQYYLRGFNLDHGTDFATTIAGIPVNMPTHGHGHGYTDANFLIPELVSSVQFKKGPYYAEEGDFSTAGAVNVNYVSFLDRPIIEVSGGGQGWARALAAASPRVGRGRVLAALELNRNDGPWTLNDDYRKVNGVVRYSEGGASSGLSVTGMFYRGEWNSTDQVPDRAIEEGVISRFGHIDATNGGETHRYSLSADVQRSAANTSTRANAYFVNYALNLFSNFTYFLDDPDNGDQFEQEDRRNIFGGRITHTRLTSWGNRSAENVFGAQVRFDRIGSVGLYHTLARQRLSTTRTDQVGQSSVGLFAQNEFQWSPVVRTTVGLRGDVFNFDVEGDDPLNSGEEASGLLSPKASVVLGPWGGTEFYVNAGSGFHSNDARGSTTTRDPGTGDPVDPTTPLARANGAEFGVRTVRIPKVQTTVAVWWLGIDSELLFIGDAGTTEATRPSRRLGVEWSTYARPRPWVALDADVAISRGKFTDGDPAGDRIPGSVESVIALGASFDSSRPMFGSIRLRHFGGRSLVEDDSVRSAATTLINAQAGFRLRGRASLVLDVFNLFDAEASDIDYFYTSRLPGEPSEGVDDIHTHPALPRSVRASLRFGF